MCEVWLLVPRDCVALVPCGHDRFCSACADTVRGIGKWVSIVPDANRHRFVRSPEIATCSMFSPESGSELCVLANFKGTLDTTAACYITTHSQFLHFFNLIHKVKLVPHFPVLHFLPVHFWSCFSTPAFWVLHLVLHFPVVHFSMLEICSLVFQSYRSLSDLIGPSLVPHFQSTPSARPSSVRPFDRWPSIR